MILTKIVKIRLNRGNIPHYKQHEQFYNTKLGDIIDVPIELAPGKSKIRVKCDFCGTEREMLHSTYIDSTKNKTEMYLCKGICSNIKREETNMKLYGVKNCFQSSDKINKIKHTMVEKYGVEHNMQTQKCLEDRIETYRKNYGCDNPTQNHDILIKSFSTGNKIKNFRNTDIYYQGSYELDFLEKYYDRIKIERGPSIKYLCDSINKVYHSDFYISELNLIVEIKSSYWKDKFASRIKYQKEEVEKQYKYIIIINKNYDEFDKLINYTSIPW